MKRYRSIAEPWTLLVSPIGERGTGWERTCSSADSAKEWAKGYSRDLAGFQGGLRFEIIDPAGGVWAWSQVKPSGSWRMKWIWGAPPNDPDNAEHVVIDREGQSVHCNPEPTKEEAGEVQEK